MKKGRKTPKPRQETSSETARRVAGELWSRSQAPAAGKAAAKARQATAGQKKPAPTRSSSSESGNPTDPTKQLVKDFRTKGKKDEGDWTFVLEDTMARGDDQGHKQAKRKR